MGKIKKLLISLGLVIGFTLTGAGVANAVTWTQGPVKWQADYRWDPYAGKYYCGVWAYNDYDWWEETFQGKRDGWEREWWALC